MLIILRATQLFFFPFFDADAIAAFRRFFMPPILPRSLRRYCCFLQDFHFATDTLSPLVFHVTLAFFARCRHFSPLAMPPLPCFHDI